MPNDLLRSAASRIAGEARSKLSPDIRRRSGRALYSPLGTVLSDSPIYFLGIYPGFVAGDPQPHNNWTIEQDLERLENDRIYAWEMKGGRKLLATPNLGRYDPRGPREQALRRFFEEVAPDVVVEGLDWSAK